MKRDFSRREFFKLAATGSLAAGIPVWLPALTTLTLIPSASIRACSLEPFSGVCHGGGQFCDVFLQHEISHWLALLDGEVNRAFTSVELGAGIRVLKGDSTGFAYCEDLTEPALMAAAATAASAAYSAPPNATAAPTQAPTQATGRSSDTG